MAIRQELLDYFSSSGITPPIERVVCAANKLEDGTIICGARHWDNVMRSVMDKLVSLGYNEKPVKVEQGFINQFGDFLDRKEALIVAKKSGQPLNMERNGAEDELYSEGVY